MVEQVFTWLLDKSSSMLSDDKEEKSDDLLNAIINGDLNLLTLLIGFISDINKMKFEGESLLSIAAFNGQSNTVKFLVSKGADIEGIDDDGLTPLHVACREGHLEIVQFLVSKGGDFNRQTFDGMTPFAMATKRGHDEVLKYLISKGVEIETSNENGWPPLIWACVRGLLSTAKYLLHEGADANHADKRGWTALHFSIYHDRLDSVKSLVTAGADVNFPDKVGTTPLHVACYNGRMQSLKYLLSNGSGADLKRADFAGSTPLHYATVAGHHNVVSFILQQKESIEFVNRRDAKGATPLHIAVCNGFTSNIDILVSGGGDLNARTNEGQTCLHLAAKLCDGSTNVEVTEELSKLMAENLQNTLSPAEALVKYLIMKGADANIANKAEKNPCEFLAGKMANLGVSQELTESSASGGRQLGGASSDVDGRTGGKVHSKTYTGKGGHSPTRSSSAIPDEVLLRLSEEIPNDRVRTLGLKLGIKQARVARFVATNFMGNEVNSDGTGDMLFTWFNDTTGAEAIPTLKIALEESGLVRLAETYLQQYI